jgi:hypothetical protein
MIRLLFLRFFFFGCGIDFFFGCIGGDSPPMLPIVA